jgi:hypothetical protein
MKTKSRSRNKAQTTRFHNTGSGPAFPLDKERKTNMAKKASGRKANRTSNRAGRRRRKNRTSASVAAPRTSAYKRRPNRGHRRHRAATTHHRRRRRNGGGTGVMQRLRNVGESINASSLVIGGVGVLGFDILAQKFLGPQSASIAAAVKVGGGLLMMNSGKKLPLVGKYAGVIGFGLAFIGTVDLLRIYVMPRVVGFLPAALLPAPAPAPTAQNGMSGLVNYYGPPQRVVPRFGGMGGLVNVPNNSPARAFV